MQDSLQQLLDKSEITTVMMTYCKAVDQGDETLLRTIYHEDAYDDHGAWYSGPASGFVEFAIQYQKEHRLLHHNLTTIHISLHQNVADVITNYIFAQIPSDREDVVELFGGRYLDRFEKRNNRWAIAKRHAKVDWTMSNLSGIGLQDMDRQTT